MVSEQLHEMDPTVMVEDPKQAIYRQQYVIQNGSLFGKKKELIK